MSDLKYAQRIPKYSLKIICFKPCFPSNLSKLANTLSTNAVLVLWFKFVDHYNDYVLLR